MNSMCSKCQIVFRRFIKDESGATAIEYGLLAVILAVGIIVGAQGIGSTITNMWNGVDNSVGAT